MREDLKKHLKDLYMRGRIDAQRFKELNAISDDLRDAKGWQEEYQMLTRYATEGYSEFTHFLTMNRLRAAEELESLFMEKVDHHLKGQNLEKAQLMLDMMETIEL